MKTQITPEERRERDRIRRYRDRREPKIATIGVAFKIEVKKYAEDDYAYFITPSFGRPVCICYNFPSRGAAWNGAIKAWDAFKKNLANQ